MITTVTLNPAIDRTLITESFLLNEVNRVKSVNINAGGKGINASKVIKSLGYETTALGFLGGASGVELLDILKNYELLHDFVWVNEKTRINTKIVDITNNTCTDLNEKGPFITNEELESLMLKIKFHSEKSDILILAGNAQDCIDTNIYYDIIKQNKNTKIILDASSHYLKNGIEAIPWLIKPNVDELSEILNKELKTTQDIVLEGKKLNEKGIMYVCVSLGVQGLVFISDKETILAKPPKITPKSTVGAGDAVVGSLAVGLLRGDSIKESLKLACAVSAASVTLEGTDVPTKELIEKLYEQVEIIKY